MYVHTTDVTHIFTHNEVLISLQQITLKILTHLNINKTDIVIMLYVIFL